ncbi:MAG: glycogen/starch/alpha-glucan family phosphorylase [Solobacterium sp.]|jgi:starch phosphorylase|nr:glycogen/starch/alpha-glucan family phosphorylase [Solobacterium sp.]MCH4048688.1 glycogen/starch/alpha-glucan family phosphorylase [Solobacterium sp.]MCH4075621.1 glycogen/starch/alpha-glucan family phosphorylase [Solobacterium sp.]MCI1313702.1 glycogen/starch/alpha-glucan family phosphorylase [Solobacterium sp.]MCI1345888.1 glycogen/starch/alpha-glucan family phosphorylase [Solobacterium sp.]
MDKKVADYAPRPLAECSDLELFNAVLNYTGEAVKERGYNTGKKKLYYISAEFLIGKLLSNNLINLGLYDTVKKELSDAGKDITELEEFESEPSLGNGGLGRLAACFIDSLATLGYPADGVGLAYHCGLFRQTFRNNKQSETPDRWLHWGQESWMHRTDKHYTVDFGGFSINSVMYEIDVTGYGSKCGKLRLFDTDTIDERVIRDQIDFDKTKIAKNLTLFLYPDDSDDAGRILRVYQEYFMCANAAQLILEEAKAKGSNLHDLYDYAAVQINDTHPTMVIPELIRRLEAEGIEEEETIEIVRKVCGYTNHTILAEALETWPESYLEKAVPQLMPVIHSLADYVEKKYDEPFVQIIDKDDRVHMANIDIHFSHSINGVAKLHTEILKNTELKPFYDIYPEKFNNKTNGITFRRWGVMCDPELTEAINGVIGDAWIKDASHLAELRKEENDPAFLKKVLAIKGDNKKNFAAYLKKNRDIEVNPDSVFDVQCKRLHEYKRQQLNLLWAISRYQEIKAGKKPVRPITMFFGAKAAPAYTIAKDIIHAILCFASIVDNDPEVSPYLKVVMLENYNVSLAEKLIPAADISEQISLASKEASGTSNMKFMLNGAVTLGTMDGANVEIADLVGKDNIYTFGESSDEVIEHYKKADYVSRDYYEKDPVLKDAVDFLVSDEMIAAGDEKNLNRLYHELLNKDWFMTFPDFEDYCRTKEVMLKDYEDRDSWSRKMLVNIAQAGFFSSDRTIEQYNTDIWHLKRDETK